MLKSNLDMNMIYELESMFGRKRDVKKLSNMLLCRCGALV